MPIIRSAGLFGILFLTVFIHPVANAQKNDSFVTEFSLEIGSLLPDQIDGVTEILQMYGLAFGVHKNGEGYAINYFGGSGEGVSWKNLSLEYRLSVLEIGGMLTEVSLGANAHLINRPGFDGSTLFGGGHVGGTILAYIGGGTHARVNMKLNVGPGVSLFIGFGLLYRPSEDK